MTCKYRLIAANLLHTPVHISVMILSKLQLDQALLEQGLQMLIDLDKGLPEGHPRTPYHKRGPPPQLLTHPPTAGYGAFDIEGKYWFQHPFTKRKIISFEDFWESTLWLVDPWHTQTAKQYATFSSLQVNGPSQHMLLLKS
eukprot:1464857-Rhodomonas_salina.2